MEDGTDAARRKVWKVMLSFWLIAFLYWAGTAVAFGVTTLNILGIGFSAGSAMMALHGLRIGRRPELWLVGVWISFGAMALILLLRAIVPDAMPAQAPSSAPSTSDTSGGAGTSPRQTTAFVTDSIAYTLVREEKGWRAAIPYTFMNLGGDTLHAENCNGAVSIGIEKKVGDAWSPFWVPITNDCRSRPILIAPGAVIDSTVTLWAEPPRGKVATEFADTTFDGTYRLTWWNLVRNYDAARSRFGDSVPTSYRTSNEFRLQPDRAR